MMVKHKEAPVAVANSQAPTSRIKLPVRIDFIGGWSDQLMWPYPAAVVNAAVGWDGKHPIELDEKGRVTSEIVGIGTGLGVSSILEAGRYLQGKPSGKGYVTHVLQWEADNGACGGWQDQIGGIEPGMKLITMDSSAGLQYYFREGWPVMDSIVLFDTGIRRMSKTIGDKVRGMIYGPSFRNALSTNVEDAHRVFISNSAQEWAETCIIGWKRLCSLVPEMDVPVPDCEAMRGYKLCGAGGGGFGIAFCKDREEVLEMFRRHGWWARIPKLLGGVRYE